MTTLVCWGIGGDSISATGTQWGSVSWPYQYLGLAGSDFTSLEAYDPAKMVRYFYYSGQFIMINMAIVGSGLNANNTIDFLNTGPNYLAPLAVVKSFPGCRKRKYLLTSMIGSNDDAITGPSGPYPSVADYAAAHAALVVAQGYDINVLCTLLPRNDGMLTEVNRGLYNGYLTDASWRTTNHIDYIFDMASETTMGNPVNCSNATYYVDGVHPTTAGHALLVSNVVNAAMATILASI